MWSLDPCEREIRLFDREQNTGGSALVFRFVRACRSCQTLHALNYLSKGTRVTEVFAFAYVSDSKPSSKLESE